MRAVNLFSVVILFFLANACGAIKTDERMITISLESSRSRGPFFGRFATDERGQRLVVAPPSGQLSGVDIVLESNEHLFVTEFTKEPNKAIEGELYRAGRLIVHKARDLREAYLLTKATGEEAHPRPVDIQNVLTPEPLSAGATILTAKAKNFHAITRSIDPVRIKEDLESLSGAKPITVNGQTFTLTHRASADMKNKARLWLRSVYEELGFTITEHRYGSGINFIAEKQAQKPVDDQILIVSGHMDTVQTSGADDDGSGVISSLSIARAIARVPLTRTIRFVAFDEEERGLLGSSAYVRELSKTGEIRRVSVINMEMTGYDSDDDGAFHAIDCNENTSATLTQAVTDAIKREGLALNKTHACTNRSDHANFWDYDRPAIVISQNFFGGDSNPCYHRSCDSTQKINWSYMEKITRASASAIASLVSEAP
jgi:hypothetical protein